MRNWQLIVVILSGVINDTCYNNIKNNNNNDNNNDDNNNNCVCVTRTQSYKIYTYTIENVFTIIINILELSIKNNAIHFNKEC